jgi:hypothetical protein
MTTDMWDQMNDLTRETVDHLINPAVGVLGWEGTVLSPQQILGRRVVPVASLVEGVHEQRSRDGWPPVLDRVTVSTWDWTELSGRVPPPAVHIAGLLSPGRHWRTGVANTAPFYRLCPVAVLLPAGVARDFRWLGYAEVRGVTVLSGPWPDDVDRGAVDVVVKGRPWSGPRIGPYARWVHEVVYAQLIEQQTRT